MSFCPNCGKESAPGSLYCAGCGAKMEQNGAQAQTAQPAPGQQQQGQQQQSYQQVPPQQQQYQYQGGANAAYPGTAAGYDANDIAQNRTVCAISYIPPLFFLPLVACKDSPYGKFHANQALVLLIAMVAVGVVFGITSAIFSLLRIFVISTLLNIINSLASLGFLALVIIAIVYTAQGDAKELPVIGKIKILK